MSPDHFQNTLSRLFDRDLSPEEFTELEQHLIHNPEARAQYWEYVDLHNVLDLNFAAKSSEQPATSKITPITSIARPKRRTLKTLALSLAALVLIGLVVSQLFIPEDTTPTLTFQVAEGTQFTLTHSPDLDDSPDGIMARGSRLQLSQGSVELTFVNGVKSIIKAPADFTIKEEDSIYVSQGTAWFSVPQQAIGFTVNTNNLHIVDLGTEFGVLATADGRDELHMLKGKARVTATHSRKESATLSAGQARRIDALGRLETIATIPTAFLTTLPKDPLFLRWSFDNADKYKATGTHPAAASIVTRPYGPPSFCPGKLGTALSFDGLGQHLITDWQGITGNRPRTVSFWLKIPADADYHRNPGIIGWGDRTLKNGKWKVTLDNQGPHTPAYLRLSWGSAWINTRQPIAPGQWQHITITSGGKLNANQIPQAEIYLNGEPAKTIPGAQAPRDGKTPQTSTSTAFSAPLIIGSDLYADPQQRHFFKGEIDELTLFDGHMTAEQVKHLFYP